MHSNCYYELVFLLIARIYFFLRAMAHECILCTSRKKEGVFCVYVSQILCVICTSAHHYVNVNTCCWQKVFFLQDTHTHIYIISFPFLMSQGFQRCDDFDITCVVFLLQSFFFFCLHPQKLNESFVFKLLCCSRFSRSPLTCYCVPPLLLPLGHQSGISFSWFGVTLATTATDGGGQLKNCSCTRHKCFSNSPPKPAALAKRKWKGCRFTPGRLVPGLLHATTAGKRLSTIATATTKPNCSGTKKKKAYTEWEKKCATSRCCCHVCATRAHSLARVLCVCHISLPLQVGKKKKTDLLHSETLLAGGGRLTLRTLALGAI